MARSEDYTNRNRNYKRFCLFCKEKKTPSYTEVETLRRFVTERGKIIGRSRSGVCSSHQAALSTAIKRARILALLPFVPKV